jgi:hypothetical protein
LRLRATRPVLRLKKHDGISDHPRLKLEFAIGFIVFSKGAVGEKVDSVRIGLNACIGEPGRQLLLAGASRSPFGVFGVSHLISPDGGLLDVSTPVGCDFCPFSQLICSPFYSP